jgi:hypothetical protein
MDSLTLKIVKSQLRELAPRRKPLVRVGSNQSRQQRFHGTPASTLLEFLLNFYRGVIAIALVGVLLGLSFCAQTPAESAKPFTSIQVPLSTQKSDIVDAANRP